MVGRPKGRRTGDGFVTMNKQIRIHPESYEFLNKLKQYEQEPIGDVLMRILVEFSRLGIDTYRQGKQVLV